MVHRADTIVSLCTFTGNSAGGQYRKGGGVTVAGLLRVENSILWGNRNAEGMDQFAQIGYEFPTVNHSLIQGLTDDLGGTGNFGDDPLFVDPDGPDDTVGTEDDDLRLLPDSPAIPAQPIPI